MIKEELDTYMNEETVTEETTDEGMGAYAGDEEPLAEPMDEPEAALLVDHRHVGRGDGQRQPNLRRQIGRAHKRVPPRACRRLLQLSRCHWRAIQQVPRPPGNAAGHA